MEPIKKVRIYEMVAERIKALITGGHYRVGDMLPPEREFAEKYGVSRSAVREAMIVLHRQGMIDNQPGRGTVVVSVTAPTVNEYLLDLLENDEDSIIELLELRKGIEIEAVSLAAKRRSNKDLALLTEKLDLLKAAVFRGENGAREDHDFHIALAEITKNELYLSIMTAISSMMHSSIKKTRAETLTRAEGPGLVLSEHEAILEAIRNRDEFEARKAMRYHLESVLVKRGLSRREGEGDSKEPEKTGMVSSAE